MNWIDTHCHLYDESFEKDLDFILQSSLEQGIQKIFVPNLNFSTLGKSLKLQKKYPKVVYSMLGLHPCYVDKNWEKECQQLFTNVEKTSWVAVGEIGLDFYHSLKFSKEQKLAFRFQIEQSQKWDIPIILHTRKAVKECLEILKSYQTKNWKGIFHCYSEGFEYQEDILNLGFLLGIGGIVTFKKNPLAEMTKSIPLDKIVLETDAPYLAPDPYRGKRNTPDRIPIIGQKVSELKEISIQDMAKVSSENADKLFFKK